MLDKYTKASLLQTILGQDESTAEYNIFAKALSLARFGDVDRLSSRAEIALDALLDTYDEDDLVEYAEMIDLASFILVEGMKARIEKLEENYNRRISRRREVLKTA